MCVPVRPREKAVCAFVRKECGSARGMWKQRGVASKLQKKLIKNEKREAREGKTGVDGERAEGRVEEERGRGGLCFIENGWTNSV